MKGDAVKTPYYFSATINSVLTVSPKFSKEILL